jgi:hypothetical protein
MDLVHFMGNFSIFSLPGVCAKCSVPARQWTEVTTGVLGYIVGSYLR